MAVQVNVQRGPLTTSRTAGIAPSSMRQAAIRRRRMTRRMRQAAEVSAWLGGSAFLSIIVVGGLAYLH